MNVFTSGAAIPVPNATVVISDETGQEQYIFYTDLSGHTPPATLFVPDKRASLTPYAHSPAYSTYQVMVSHTDFVTQILRGVQIFDSINTILPVNLQPRLIRVGSSEPVNIINIPPTAGPGVMPIEQPFLLEDKDYYGEA
jgi:hypothetical protein